MSVGARLQFFRAVEIERRAGGARSWGRYKLQGMHLFAHIQSRGMLASLALIGRYLSA